MKLNELYTINHLNVKMPTAGKQTNYDTLGDFMEELTDKGFTRLGQGRYGAVFTSDKLGYAVKIFITSDKGYTVFLRYLLANRGNPHLPIIRGNFKQISADYSACRMELLDGLSQGEEMIVNKLLELIMTGFLKPESFIKAVRSKFSALDEQTFSDSYLNTMFDLYRTGRRNGRTFDLHAGNVMKRDATLVITDPFT